MRDPHREHWESLYRAAVLELDRQELPGCIRAAEEAIHLRLIFLDSGSDHHGERPAIEDAFAGTAGDRNRRPRELEATL